jgi:DNA invertase Pin-like site-specific DNA recombinase
MSESRVAYSYVRFSSAKQKDGTSVRRQTTDTIAGESPESWCERQDPTVILDTQRRFTDLGRSAWKPGKQKELEAFLAMVDDGRIRPGSYLLIEKIDRITRQGTDEGIDLLKKILKKNISIVTLANGRIYGPDSFKKMEGGWVELMLYAQAAEEYSRSLSGRLKAAWEEKRERAARRVLVTATMPPWLRAVGKVKSEDRHAEIIPEKAEIVRDLFRQAIEGVAPGRINGGMGMDLLLKNLKKNDTPSLTGKGWSRATIRRILSDRQTLGEFQPCAGGKPVGPPIPDYFPAVIDPATFHRAQESLSSRKNNHRSRSSKVDFLFSGMVRDARDSTSTYYAALRVPNKYARERNIRHHVLRSTGRDAASFPLPIFERVVLREIQEIDPREILPPDTRAQDEITTLERELAEKVARIKQIDTLLDGCEPDQIDSLTRLQAREEKKRAEIRTRLTQARLRQSNPLAESWAETGELLRILETAEDPVQTRQRLRGALRRVISQVYLLVVRRNHTQVAKIQISFKGIGEDREWRDFFVVYVPPKANQSGKVPGRLWRNYSQVHPLESDMGTNGINIRTPEGAEEARRGLERMDLTFLEKEPASRFWEEV